MPPKVRPIDIDSQVHHREPFRADAGKSVLKSRLRRVFDRQFPGVLRISLSVKVTGGAKLLLDTARMEQSTVERLIPSRARSSAKMVHSFIEESNEKRSVEKRSRDWCNCFDGNDDGSSGDKFDIWVHQRDNWVKLKMG